MTRQHNMELKATALENYIIAAGLAQAFINSGGSDAKARKVALDGLSAERGSPQTTSEDTWATVLRFLIDRYVR